MEKHIPIYVSTEPKVLKTVKNLPKKEQVAIDKEHAYGDKYKKVPFDYPVGLYEKFRRTCVLSNLSMRQVILVLSSAFVNGDILFTPPIKGKQRLCGKDLEGNAVNPYAADIVNKSGIKIVIPALNLALKENEELKAEIVKLQRRLTGIK